MRANYKMQRLFLDQPMGADFEITLDKAQANYIGNVLRMKTDDEILVFNGRDGEWQARVEAENKRKISLYLQTQTRAQTIAPDLIYCFAPLKIGRLDYMVQKAVEMGAGVLQPVITQHTQNHRLNVDKMKANCIEAAEQCGILSIPTCHKPIKLDAMLDAWDQSRTLIFCDEDAHSNNPTDQLLALKNKPLALLIGPEGGFSDAESALLRSKDFVIPIPLGPRILRADTAAVAAMALVQATKGDWK